MHRKPTPVIAPRLFFVVFSQDHAFKFTGINTGAVTVLCMNPLDLLKVGFQVLTRGPEGDTGRGLWRALCDIDTSEGWREPYRSMGQNFVGTRGAGDSTVSVYYSLFAPPRCLFHREGNMAAHRAPTEHPQKRSSCKSEYRILTTLPPC
jgi:hypothetical protein